MGSIPMELVVDFERSLDASAGSCEIALGAEHRSQHVERGGDVWMVLSSMDLVVDFERALDANAGTREVTPGAEHSGQLVKVDP